MIKPLSFPPLVVAIICLTSRLPGQIPMLAGPHGGIEARPDVFAAGLPDDPTVERSSNELGLPDRFELLPPATQRFPSREDEMFLQEMIETPLEQAAQFHEPPFSETNHLPPGDALHCHSCGDVLVGGSEESCGCRATSSIANDWTPWRALHSLRPRLDLALLDLSYLDIGKRFRESRTRDRGIGYERVMFAPQVLDTAVATPHFGVRYQIDRGLQTPDRAEYFWAAPTVGPGADPRVNTQDLAFRLAVGNKNAMAFTQYTLRSLDPRNSGNTTGMGDMVVGAQALIVDGKRTKLASIFRTYLATGPARRGLGTGHTSLEPGVLVRHCTSPETYWFGELKYWIPLGGDPDVSGDVLSTGIGVSSIASESDVFAFIPTLEMRTLTFLFGSETVAGGSRRVDGNTAVEFYPGARFVLGPRRDAGLLEFGFSPGVTVADSEWFDTRIVFDIRLVH